MKDQTDNLQVARWTDDPTLREKFLTKVDPMIDRESKSMARSYRVGMDHEDIKSEIQAKLMQQMLKVDADGPFATDSPDEAANFFLGQKNFKIHEWARSLARKIAKKQSRQAEILADVSQPGLPPEIEAQLLALAKSLPRLTLEVPRLTPRDNDIVRKELLRQVGIDDLPTPIFDQVAQAAGVSSSEQRAYNEYHEEHGQNSVSDRKAWSRARAKILAAFTRAKLAAFLVIVFALSLVLYNLSHQKTLAHQTNFSHQKALVHQANSSHQKTLAHQANSSHQKTLAHQANSSHQKTLAHQANSSHQKTLVHQTNSSHQKALAHQTNSSHHKTLAHQTA